MDCGGARKISDLQLLTEDRRQLANEQTRSQSPAWRSCWFGDHYIFFRWQDRVQHDDSRYETALERARPHPYPNTRKTHHENTSLLTRPPDVWLAGVPLDPLLEGMFNAGLAFW
jgi:hypothetical protein